MNYCDSLSQFSRGHNLLILNKDLSDDQTLFYAIEVLSKG